MSETPEQIAKRRASYNAWRAENKERRREYNKKWREANAEHVAAYGREYEKNKRPRPEGAKKRLRPAKNDKSSREREAEALALRRLDPEYNEAYLARKRENDARRRQRVRDDPVRLAAYQKRRSEYQRRYLAKVRKDVVKAAAPGEVFFSKLFSNDLYAAVMAEVKNMKSGDYRDDLVAEAIVIMLEGEIKSPKEAVKAARKALGKDSFKTVSMDAPNAVGKTMHEYLTTEGAYV